MVYVLNIDGQPLMPTDRHGKVRHLLKDGRAEVVKCCPFTIRLLYDSTHYTQDIVLGVAYKGREYFIFGRRQSGFFDLRNLSGCKVNKGSLSYRKIGFLEPRQYYLCERRVMDTQGCA